MGNIKVNYRKNWGNDGTVYTQTITTTKEIIKKFNAYIEEIHDQLHEKFILTNEDIKELCYLELLLHDTNYITLTTLDHFKKFYLKEIYMPPKKDKNYERILQRNTIIKVV